MYREDEGQYPGTARQNYSSDTSRIIDEETRRIIDECYATAERILTENRDILEAMKDALMEYETIDNDQVKDLMARVKVRPPRDWHVNDVPPQDAPPPSPASTNSTPPNNVTPIGGPAA